MNKTLITDEKIKKAIKKGLKSREEALRQLVQDEGLNKVIKNCGLGMGCQDGEIWSLMDQALLNLVYAIESEFIKEEDTIIRIRSIIMVERESQKGIIIGHKGSALKRVGAEARKDLETFFGKKVFIELYVKVNKDWRSNKNQLRRFGYQE